MKNAIIGTIATAGVAFLVAVIVGAAFRWFGFNGLLSLIICSLILASGVIFAMTWDALDNGYTSWWRRTFNL